MAPNGLWSGLGLMCLVVLAQVGGETLRPMEPEDAPSGRDKHGDVNTTNMLKALVARQAEEIRVLRRYKEQGGGHECGGAASRGGVGETSFLEEGVYKGWEGDMITEEVVEERRAFYRDVETTRDRLLSVLPGLKGKVGGSSPCHDWKSVIRCIGREFDEMSIVGGDSVGDATELPDDLFDFESPMFKSIKRVTISNLSLTKLPRSLYRLPFLKTLGVTNTHMGRLPSEIHKMKLRNLNFSGNRLTSFPMEVFKTKLSSLDLRRNNITDLSVDLSHKGRLPRRVILSENGVTGLVNGAWLCKMKNLVSLRLTRNKITGFTEPSERVGELRMAYLSIEHNLITHLPEWLGSHQPRLTTFVASYNPLNQFDFLKNMTKLRLLYMEGCGLKTVPSVIGEARNIYLLRLGNNSLVNLDGTAPLKKLRSLYAAHNRLQVLPGHVGWKNLNTLDLNFNLFTEVPPLAKALTKMRKLYLEGNRITRLPAWLNREALPSLARVDFQANNITWDSIPTSVQGAIDDGVVVLTNGLGTDRVMVDGFRAALLEAGKSQSWIDSWFPAGDRVCGPAKVNSLPRDNLWRPRVNCPEKDDGVYSLDLSGIFDGWIPASLFDLPGMEKFEKLDLSSNKLGSLPDTIDRMQGLVELRLSHNVFTSIPEAVTRIRGLQSLNAKFCRISYLTPRLQDLKSLRVLLLGLNQIQVVPPSVGNITNLREFDLTQNEISEIPEEIVRLEKLSGIYLAHNRLRRLPDSFFRLQGLNSVLDLSHNHLEELPETFEFLSPYIYSINLADNQLKHLPKTFGFLRLREVVLDNNPRLTELPPSMALCVTMERLSARSCALRALPDMSGWKRMKALEVPNNELREWPRIGAWQRAIKIDLSRNLLESVPSIPPSIGSKTAGELILDISSNLISSFPLASLWTLATRGNHTNLLSEGYHTLDISHNRLVDVFAGVDWGSFPFNEPLPELSVIKISDHMLGRSPDRIGVVSRRLLGLKPDDNLQWVATRGFEAEQDCSELLAIADRMGRQQLRAVRCVCKTGFYLHPETLLCTYCLEGATCENNQVTCRDGSYLESSPAGVPERCVKCTERGQNCANNAVIARPGYWQPDPTSPEVYSCRSEEICLGGAVNATDATSTCAQGHVGALCQACESGRYADVSTGKCLECPSKFQTGVYLALMSLSVIAVVSILTLMQGGTGTAAKSEADSKLGATQARQGSAGQGANEGAASDTAGMIRLNFSFGQILAAFPAIYDVPWGSWLESLAEYLAWMNLDVLSQSSLTCMWAGVPGSGAGPSSFSFIESMLVTVAVPPLMCLGAILCVAVMAILKRLLKPQAGVADSAMKVFIGRWCFIVMSFAYLPLCTKATQFFYCRSFDGGATYWIHSDLSTQCFTEEWYWNLPVALTTLVAIGAGLPLCVVVIAMTPQKSLVLAGISRIFNVYKRRYRWWDGLELVRKFIITAMVLLVSSLPEVQVVMALMLSFAVLVVHMQCMPFIRPELNTIQTMQLVLTFCTLSTAILRTSRVPSNLTGVFSSVVILLDAAAILGVLVMVAVILAAKLRRVMEKAVSARLMRRSTWRPPV